MSQLTFEDARTLQRLINAAEAVCTITANGELFAACDGAEPQRTTTVAALDELEHAHEAASAVLGSLILRNATPVGDEYGGIAALQLPIGGRGKLMHLAVWLDANGFKEQGKDIRAVLAHPPKSTATTIDVAPSGAPQTTILRFGGRPLPEIGERQAWCCNEGCGICSPIQVDFEYLRTTDDAGNLVESRTQKVWRSDCCNAELMLWDEIAQTFVAWETK